MKKRKKTALVILFPLVLLGFIASASIAAPKRSIDLLKPSVSNGKTFQKVTDGDAEVYINRTGEVTLAAKDIFGITGSTDSYSRVERGDFPDTELVLSFFPEQKIRITVDSESRPNANLLLLRGHKGESKISTFTMTLTNETYLITYQDLDNGMIYKVVGDMTSGEGQVTEIDLEKLPPTYDAKPVIPDQ